MDSLHPFLWGSCIPYNMPVYLGAQCIFAESLTDASPRTSRQGYDAWVRQLAVKRPSRISDRCQLTLSPQRVALANTFTDVEFLPLSNRPIS